MSGDNAAIVRALYEAFAAGDASAVLATMRPDVVWNEADDFPYADRNPYVGPEAVAEGVFGRIAEEWEDFRVDVAEVIDAGDTVVALGRYLGTYRATCRAQDTQFAHVWRLSDGKIAGFQQYANTLHVAQVTERA